MLNMLNMLNYFASFWSLWASHRPNIIQHIQHSQHFSRKKHIFRTFDPTWFNIFNMSAERSTCPAHVEIFLLKETLFWAMLNYFPWKNHCLGHVESFPLKEPFFNYIFLRKCWICWASIWSLQAYHRPKIIQHIQHIQHFSTKKHIFRTSAPTWFNIFNISAERSTFPVDPLLKDLMPRTGEIEHFFKNRPPSVEIMLLQFWF